MTKNEISQANIDHDQILDRIYAIALEPALLDDFIDLWANENLAEQFADNDDAKAGAFDTLFKAHLKRAEAFLQLGDTAAPTVTDHLKPYDAFAAFIINKSLIVERANPGAQAAFGMVAGDRLTELDLHPDARSSLLKLTQDVVQQAGYQERLFKTENETKRGAMLFRVIRIAENADNGPAALVVSTHIHWRDSIGKILNHAFKLTQAEQNVVGKLTEGHDAKSIAIARDTTVGTVRGQIKSIISKMNVRSQADVVRFALILSDFPNAESVTDSDNAANPAVPSADWLQSEVWKPFKSIAMPDGRTMTYHDMGPPNGNPVLFSHMGSAMVRWPRTMVKLAFQNNLRIICPIRAGYGHSDNIDLDADVLASTSRDTVFLLESLGITCLPYAIHGSDFPLAADLIDRNPDLISELIGIGARPCLPGGMDVEGAGRWQRFFVWTARHNPKLVEFAANAVMMMTKRIGAEAMLQKLCKDSPADLALLEETETKQVLIANLELMAGPSTNAGRAFAMEYTAFHTDWSHLMQSMRHIPLRIFIAEEDPTINIFARGELRSAYPWIKFEVIPNTGLALIYQEPKKLISILAAAAKAATDTCTNDLSSKPAKAVS
jgi:pimeloyl-ACP methyl ester carboxylesterase/DNA-binding CsgD family transcriptional regulator